MSAAAPRPGRSASTWPGATSSPPCSSARRSFLLEPGARGHRNRALDGLRVPLAVPDERGDVHVQPPLLAEVAAERPVARSEAHQGGPALPRREPDGLARVERGDVAAAREQVRATGAWTAHAPD